MPQKYENVEAWTDTWDPNDATKWKHKLGNLALLNGNSNSKIGNGCFETKRELLNDSPYPLTKGIANSLSWDVNAVEENHNKYIDHAKEVWKLCLENDA